MNPRNVKIKEGQSVRGQSSGVEMAPALLAKSEDKKGKKLKKVPSSSKQNAKKMDPEESVVKVKRAPVDFDALKEQLAAEDSFITALLANIPTQGVSADAEVDKSDLEESPPAVTQQSENRACNPEELKERLAAKLSEFKGEDCLVLKLMSSESYSLDITGRKLNFSDKKMKTKLKRKLDKLEKKKLKKKNNKMKVKIAKLAQATMKAAASTSNTSPASTTVKTEVPELPIQSRPPKPIFNSEGRMVFSKFDFGELTTPTAALRKTNLDPKAALHKIKKVKEKVKHLEEQGDAEKAKSIVEKKAWEGAIQRAEGVKVQACIVTVLLIAQ